MGSVGSGWGRKVGVNSLADLTVGGAGGRKNGDVKEFAERGGLGVCVGGQGLHGK